jgi:hypothetical protein
MSALKFSIARCWGPDFKAGGAKGAAFVGLAFARDLAVDFIGISNANNTITENVSFNCPCAWSFSCADSIARCHRSLHHQGALWQAAGRTAVRGVTFGLGENRILEVKINENDPVIFLKFFATAHGVANATAEQRLEKRSDAFYNHACIELIGLGDINRFLIMYLGPHISTC